MNDEIFRFDLFNEEQLYEEGPLIEKKAIVEIWDFTLRAEFIRDIIALANSARLFGKTAFMLLGISDELDLNGKNIIVGIDPLLAHYRKQLERKKKIVDEYKIWEEIKREIGAILHFYITPLLPFEYLKHIEINGKPVAYLVIPAISSGQPFQVQKNFPSRGNTLLTQGQCWIRFGESKREISVQEISPTDSPFCYSYSQTPYILPRMWEVYLKYLRTFILKQPEIIGYQDLSTVTGKSLNIAIDDFLEGMSQVLLISGKVGCGKSKFIVRKASELVDNNLNAVQSIIQREEFSPPPFWTPIFLPLKNLHIRNEERLVRLLINLVNSHGGFWQGRTRPQNPERLFEDPKLRWLMIFDGFDEIYGEEQRRNFLAAINAFIQSYPKIKIIITSRKTTQIMGFFSRAEEIEISPLSLEQIKAYIGTWIDAEETENVVTFLLSHPDLLNLASNPMNLETAMQELTGIRPSSAEDDLSSLGLSELQNKERNNFKEDIPVELVDEDGHEARIRSGEKIKIETQIREEELILDEALTEVVEIPSVDQDSDNNVGEKPIRPGVFLNKVYRGLWAREKTKQGERNAQFYWEATEKLAIKTDGHMKYFQYDDAFRIFNRRKKAVFWAINLGVLQERDEGMLSFATNITKSFFASSHLNYLFKSGQFQRINEMMASITDIFKHDMLILLNDLNPEAQNQA